MIHFLLTQALLQILGLGALGLLAWAANKLWRSDVVTGYRFSVVILGAALLLAPGQILFSGVRATSEHGSGSDGGPVRQVVEEVTVLRPKDVGGAWGEDGPASPRTALHPGEPEQLAHSTTRPANQTWFPWLLISLYVSGVFVVAFFQTLRFWQTRRLLRLCQPERDPYTLALWREIAGHAPVCGRVRLLSCAGLDFPCCGGLWRPYLILPKGMAPTPQGDGLAWGLRHELVHLERRDAWIALFQAFLIVLFWFHPVAWWLSRQIDWLREASCDAWVVRRTGQRRSYALALWSYAARLPRSAWAPALLHWSGPPSQLRRRIEMLACNTGMSKGSPRLLSWLALAAGLLALGTSQMLLAGTLAGPPNAAAPTLLTRRLIEKYSANRPRAESEGSDERRYKRIVDSRHIDIRTVGSIQYDGARAEIIALSAQGSVRLVERDGSLQRRLDITPRPAGGLVYTYAVGGQERPFDEEGEAWAKRIFREVGTQAFAPDDRFAELARSSKQGSMK